MLRLCCLQTVCVCIHSDVLQLSQRRFVSIFLGLLLNVVLFVLFALCCILIYSLMTINVQKRTFELAVRRLIGTSRTVLIAMLSMQVSILPTA